MTEPRKRTGERSSYALEKFSSAVRALATGPGDVRSRLLGAYLIFHTVGREDLPSSLRRDFQWIVRMLTRREPRWKDGGRLQAPLARMQNRTGARIARKIVDIEYAFESYCRRLKPRR